MKMIYEPMMINVISVEVSDILTASNPLSGFYGEEHDLTAIQ